MLIDGGGGTHHESSVALHTRRHLVGNHLASGGQSMSNKLESLLRPLLRVGTRMELRRASSPLPRATSKFGGAPFATRDETWPPCAECHRPLSFVGQVDLRQTTSEGSLHFDLFQFFHCWGCCPWGDDGKRAWLVRTYRAPESLEAADLPVPSDPHALRECQVLFQRGQFLPDWEAADGLCPEAIQAANEIDPDDALALYEQVAGSSTVTVLSVRSPPPWRELAGRCVPVVNACLFRAA